MEDLFDIQHQDGKIFLNLVRPLESYDFKVVTEVSNSIRWICDDEDTWEFTEVDQEKNKAKKRWMATLKLRYFHSDDLREKIETLIKEENINLNPMQRMSLATLYKVQKLHLFSTDLKEEHKETLKALGTAKEEEFRQTVIKSFAQEVDRFNFMSISGGIA